MIESEVNFMNVRYNLDAKITDIDLIPKEGPVTGSYICTWWNQSGCAADLGIQGTGLSEWRDALNQDALFETEKYYHPAPRAVRSNLIFLMDDGWDIPEGTPNDAEHRYLYGSVDPDSKKFSRYGNTPEERLTGISKKVKEMGYAGLGLWISPQECGLEKYKTENARTYWEERAKWSHNAGVLYWKVDWGGHDWDDEYRELISDCVHKYAPGLLCEHAIVQLPCTHHHKEENFLEQRALRAKRQMTFADAFRTYDVLEPFDKVCTLRRAHEALLASEVTDHSGAALINGENLYAISASLGFTVGIMNYNEEALACINWQKVSPPFGVFDAPYNYSESFLDDTLFFDSEICEWAPCKGITVKESAPFIMARGCPMPTVTKTGEHYPYILASKNPGTGAYSVASIPRSVDPISNAYFPADVVLHEVCPESPVGIFGIFNTLTIELDSQLSPDARFLAQDLTSDKAIDITEYVTFSDNRIVLEGKLLRLAGKIARGHNNKSAPSVIFKIIM